MQETPGRSSSFAFFPALLVLFGAAKAATGGCTASAAADGEQEASAAVCTAGSAHCPNPSTSTDTPGNTVGLVRQMN